MQKAPAKAGAFASGVSSSPDVIAGLDPAIPIMWHGRALRPGGRVEPGHPIQ
jgi:hypothetical protein